MGANMSRYLGMALELLLHYGIAKLGKAEDQPGKFAARPLAAMQKKATGHGQGPIEAIVPVPSF